MALIFINILFFSNLLPAQTSQGPYIQQEKTLASLDTINKYTSDIAISGDGSTAIFSLAKRGAVVYTFREKQWVKQSFLTDTKITGSYGSQSFVALSRDGNTAVVAGDTDSTGMAATWVFTRTAGVWSKHGQILPYIDSIESSIREPKVDISSDGKTIVVGNAYEDNLMGAAFVYTLIGNKWVQQGGKISASDAIGNTALGGSVSISGDGNTIVLGAHLDNDFKGGAWIFVRSGNTWKQQGLKLRGSFAMDRPNMGCTVEMSADGNTVAMGGSMDNNWLGSVWIFTRSGSIWTQQGSKFTGSGMVGQPFFAGELKMADDGNTLVVGGGGDNDDKGAVWVFTKSGNEWTQKGNKFTITSVANTKYFGQNLAISSDGNTFIANVNIANGLNDIESSLCYTYKKLPILTLTLPIAEVEAYPGNSVRIDYTIKNSELALSPPVKANYFISKDITFDSTDLSIGEVASIPIIIGGSSFPVSVEFKVPLNFLGKYYILPVMDANNSGYKFNPANVVGAIPITVGNPDLYFSVKSLSNLQVLQGDSLKISSSLSNIGTVGVRTKDVKYYFSKDSIVDPLDLSIGTFNDNLISAGKSFALQMQGYKIPDGTAVGQYYIVLEVNNSRLFTESNYSNNKVSIPFTVLSKLPDAKIISPLLSSTVVLPGEVIKISCSIANSGLGALPQSTLAYYLSYDSIFDINDIAIASSEPIGVIEAGNQVATNFQNYTVPANASPGVYYILFFADKFKQIEELNELNNVASVGVRVNSFPDLIPTPPVLSKEVLLPGDTLQVVSIVKNIGGTQAGTFEWQYFISSDSLYQASDTPVLSKLLVFALPAGVSDKATSQSFTLPSTTGPGTYYLLSFVDKLGTVNESNESNNVSFVKFVVSSLPDIEPTIVVKPAMVLPGESVEISAIIKNSGSNISSAFQVRYFLSSDELYDINDTPILEAISIPSLLQGANTPVVVKSFIFPTNTPAGTYYILFEADVNNVVKESREKNNTASAIVNIGSFSDLLIVNPFVKNLNILRGNAVTISCSVVNLGSSGTINDFKVQYFLSTNDTYDLNDIPLSQPTLYKALASSALINIPVADFKIPQTAISGKYHILMFVDSENSVKELSKSNNVVAVAIQINELPDYHVIQPMASPSVISISDSVAISFTLLNNGGKSINSPNVDLQYFLSVDTVFERSKDVAITDVLKLESPTANGSIQVSARKILMPAGTAVGKYYIIIVADERNIEIENLESNNVAYIPITIKPIAPELADLEVQNPVLNPSSLISGDSISISCTVKNVGTGKSSKASFFQYFLSKDGVKSPDDVMLGNLIAIPQLEKGLSINISKIRLAIPATTNGGKYHVLFCADEQNLLVETNESNNVASLLVTIAERSDLTVANPISQDPMVLYPGDSSKISFTVTNIGKGKSEIPVTMRWYLSLDNEYDSADVALGQKLSIPVLDSSAKVNFINTTFFVQPNLQGGNYYVLSYVDNDNVLKEQNESNNVFALQVKVQGFADLHISKAIGSPQKIYPGDSATFKISIENKGKGITESSFRIKYFLSKNQVFDNADLSISGLLPATILAVGAVENYNFTYKFPATTLAGTYYILALADAGMQIKESDENNNFGYTAIQIGNTELTDLTVDRLFSDLSILNAGDTIALESTIKNIGKASAERSFLTYFLSSDAVFSNDDLNLSALISVNALNIDETHILSAKKFYIPQATLPGSYFILCLADVENNINESNKTNNIAARQLRIDPSPDLRLLSPKASTISIYNGDTLILNAVVENAAKGSDTRKPHSFHFFLSKDQLFDNSDVSIGPEVIIPIIKVNGQHAIAPQKIQISDTISGGYYYILSVVDYKKEISESNEYNNVISTLIHVNTRPVVTATQRIPDAVEIKNNLTINFKVKSELPLSVVGFTYRKVTNPVDSVYVPLTRNMQLDYTAIIPANFFDEIGVEYTVHAIDSSGNKSIPVHGMVSVKWPAPGLTIPYKNFGRFTANYRIIAIPLQLKQMNVDSVFYKTLGHYDNTKWRTYNYRNESTTQYGNGLKDFEIGYGYWFIVKDSTGSPLTTGAGTTVLVTHDKPFSVNLVEGWNLIGNPYNMKMYWSDILNYSKNNKTVLKSWKKWEGKWNSNDGLERMEGGYVLVTAPTTLYFPTQKRMLSTRLGVNENISMNEENWQMNFLLSSTHQVYSLSGIGMNENATVAKDDMDDITPPRFIDFLELNFANFDNPKYKLTKDIVPPAPQHIWDFTIDAEATGTKTLTWDNSFLKSFSKKLILQDVEADKIIDMGQGNSYSFNLNVSKSFKIYYGSSENLGQYLQPQTITLSAPIPNPFSENTSFQVSLPPSLEQYQVDLSVFNAQGIKIGTIASGVYSHGYYDFCLNSQSEMKLSSGLIIIKLLVTSQGGLQRELSRKVVYR